jgi:hypothetical protein
MKRMERISKVVIRGSPQDGSRLTINGSRLTIDGSRLTVNGVASTLRLQNDNDQADRRGGVQRGVRSPVHLTQRPERFVMSFDLALINKRKNQIARTRN